MSYRREFSPPRGRSPPPQRQFSDSPPRGDFRPRYERSPSPRGYPERRYRSPPRERGGGHPYYNPNERFEASHPLRSQESFRERGPPPPHHYPAPSGYGSSRPPRSYGNDLPPPRRRRSPPRLSDAQIEASTTLFVGNLPYDWKADDCVQFFQRFGDVQSVSVGFNRRTQQSKGYAFVQFSSKRDAEEAFDRTKGAQVQGRTIRVDWDAGYERKHGPETVPSNENGSQVNNVQNNGSQMRGRSPPRGEYFRNERGNSPPREGSPRRGEYFRNERGISPPRGRMEVRGDMRDISDMRGRSPYRGRPNEPSNYYSRDGRGPSPERKSSPLRGQDLGGHPSPRRSDLPMGVPSRFY